MSETIQQRLDNLLSKLTVKNNSQGEYACICPAHNDKTASLSIKMEDDRILVHCHAGCDTVDILTSVGLKLADLFEPKERVMINAKGQAQAYDAAYKYVDVDNSLIFEVVRFKNPKDFRQRRPDPDKPGKHIWSIKGITKVPYNLPNVISAIKADSFIFIVEGEKDVHTLAKFKCVGTTNSGGAGKWLDQYSEYLRGAHVIIIPDNDKPGCDHARQIAVSLSGISLSTQLLRLPGLKEHGDLTDWLKDHSQDEFFALAAAAPAWIPGMLIEPISIDDIDTTGGITPGDKAAGLPNIRVSNRQTRDITKEAVSALESANKNTNKLFIRMGQLVRLRTEISSKIFTPEIDEVTPDIIRNLMSTSANYHKLGTTGNIINCAPPLDIARDILARGQWEFPRLEAITESPVMRPDGSVLNTPGYDAMTHLYFAPGATLAMPPIPDTPKLDDISAARDCIEDILWDFPFITPSDKANLVGMLLTQVIRPAIDGNVPIGIVDAPQPGSGKGLLTKIINLIATGKPLAAVTAPTQPDEWPKQITSLLLSGTTMIVFDNLEAVLDNPDLAALMTLPEWKGRILGQSKMVSIPNRATILVTGNNVKTGGDIARRCYWTTINPNTSTPELRKGFRHANICKYVLQHRGEILAALFTIARAWYAAGQPQGATPILGSFDEWSRIVGGILDFAGIAEFLANAETHRAEADVFSGENETFLRAIMDVFQSSPFTTKELNSYVAANEWLEDAIPDYLLVARSKNEAGFVRACGKLFGKIAGRRLGKDNITISRAPVTHSNKTVWYIACNKADTISADPTDDVKWIL